MAGYSPFIDINPSKIYEKSINGTFSFPTHFSPEARDLISNLLIRENSQRLGNRVGGFLDIMNHPFFENIEWGSFDKTLKTKFRKHHIKRLSWPTLNLQKSDKIKLENPPWIPEINSNGDSKNFQIYPEDQKSYKSSFSMLKKPIEPGKEDSDLIEDPFFGF